MANGIPKGNKQNHKRLIPTVHDGYLETWWQRRNENRRMHQKNKMVLPLPRHENIVVQPRQTRFLCLLETRTSHPIRELRTLPQKILPWNNHCGILKRLGRLTSIDPGGYKESIHQTINKIYPDHTQALTEANLLHCPNFKKRPKMKDHW